jgi:hypothetical protein
MDKIDVSIVEYLGKLDIGVLVLISLVYRQTYFEGTFFYTDKDVVLTISEELEEIIGDIKLHHSYQSIVKELIKKVVPYQEIYDRIDKVDFSKFVQGVIEIQSEDIPEVIDNSQIKPSPGI